MLHSEALAMHESYKQGCCMIHAYIANASLCNIPFLFMCFLCHRYIFTISVENFYFSLVSVLFMEHKLGIRLYLNPFWFRNLRLNVTSLKWRFNEVLILGPWKLSYSKNSAIALASAKEYSSENLQSFRLTISRKACIVS